MIRIIVHRGTHQIGGCITEIRTDTDRILIDMGEELPDPASSVQSAALFDIPGVTSGAPDCGGVFFTHYHSDHIGLLDQVLPEVPLYMGAAAKEIYATLYARTHEGMPLPRLLDIQPVVAPRPISVGSIRVTPILTDHSAYDAYMYLIEAEGKRILHTGDFRTHGFRGNAVIPTLNKHVGQVDVLITEGTSLSRDEKEDYPTEWALQQEAIKRIKQHKYVFVVASSTNIDRIAAFNRATPRGKYFITDYYQSQILQTVREYAARYTSLYAFEKLQVYNRKHLERYRDRGFCMMVRNNGFFRGVMKEFDPSECLVLFSMWQGYLKDPEYGFDGFLEGYTWQHHHTSGHADRRAIIEVCRAVRPRIGILPIHSTRPEVVDQLGLEYPVIHVGDGEEIRV